MKIIRPITLTDAMLTSSNVPETDYTAYNAATTYVGVDRCIDTTLHTVYESLPSSGIELLTLDVAPAVPWLPDWTLTGQTSLQTCVVCQYLTSLTYLVRDRSGVFTLGEIIGVTGTAVLLADQGGANPVFVSAANKARPPSVDVALATPLWWKEISATNRWKAFDSKVGSQTAQATSITYKITPGELFDSIAFLNLDAVTAQIVLTDPLAGVVYDETIDLLTTVVTGASEVYDWYSYFFSSYFRIADAVKLDITPYLNAVVDITITYTGGTAKVGSIILGLQTNIGTTLYSPQVGIVDYSRKSADENGVYSVTPGAFSKRMSLDLSLRNESIDGIQNLLAFYRSTLLVWIGVETYSSMIIYGFYKDFSIVMSYPAYSECNIEIEGLT